LTEQLESRFIKPIVNASYPGTLAGLALFGLQVTYLSASPPLILRIALSLGGFMFLTASTSVFFYTLYPTKKRLWTLCAITFLLGLLYLFIATSLSILAA
jgi:hypothetical protein